MRVSVITPSYQQGRFIRETIESVLSQDSPVDEYLVVDGGSTDETLAILASYGDRLRWISEKDRGQADAVNKGIRMTGGEIIGWLNSDDVYVPGAVAAARAAFEADPEVDLVYGDYEVIDEASVCQGTVRIGELSPWDILTFRGFIPQPGAFFRRRLVERIGALDLSYYYCLDTDFFMRAARAARYRYLGRTMARYRLCRGTKTVEAAASRIVRETTRAAYRNGGALAAAIAFGRLQVKYTRVAMSRAKRRLLGSLRPA